MYVIIDKLYSVDYYKHDVCIIIISMYNRVYLGIFRV